MVPKACSGWSIRQHRFILQEPGGIMESERPPAVKLRGTDVVTFTLE